MEKNDKTNPKRKKYWTEFFKTLDKSDNNEIKIHFDDFVRMLEVRRNGYGYHHLTNWRTLCKMMEPVESPTDGKPHRMLHLGAAANMNDEDDKKCGKNVFFSSFSFGPMENVSMWNGYGIPTPEAVRVKFSSRSISDWERKFNAGKINVYGVNSANQLEPLSCTAKLELVQVAYWSKKEKGFNYSDSNEGLLFYDSDKFRISRKDKVVERMREKPYMFKEAGWSYENETRLVLVFDEDLADTYRRVAVDFDGPLDWLDKNFAKDVTQGPWYDENSPLVKDKAGDHSLGEAKPSRYYGKINMRSMCDFCGQAKDNCQCPFKPKNQVY